MMEERWKEVFGYDVLYEISDSGRLRTKHHGRQGYLNRYRYVEPVDNGHGYLKFNFMKSGIQKTVYVHKLVADAFVENPNGYAEVNHIDENKANNRFDNLEWCTHKQNCNHGTRNIRSSKKKMMSVRCVETGQVFESIKAAAAYIGVANTALCNCLNKRSKSCCGKTWEYVQQFV